MCGSGKYTFFKDKLWLVNKPNLMSEFQSKYNSRYILLFKIHLLKYIPTIKWNFLKYLCTGLFLVTAKCFWNDWKKLSHFSQKVWKYRPMITVTVSYDTTVRQMTEMSQRKNQLVQHFLQNQGDIYWLKLSHACNIINHNSAENWNGQIKSRKTYAILKLSQMKGKWLYSLQYLKWSFSQL